MAKERINPQFDIQRVVQPTATPVDVYYRPIMAEPDVTRQLQIARALKDLNPQLERLMSDAVAMGVSGEREAGRLEALNAPSEDVLRRKATEWIEKEGGIAPWRYQSALETAGARLMRDKYQASLYNQLDSLSDPFNADGTTKDPQELSNAMQKAYADASIPDNSHYMQKGALRAKAEIDGAVMAKVTQMRAEKVKLKASQDLSDSMYRALSVSRPEDIEETLSGPIKAMMDEYYSQGYGSGDDVLLSVYSDRIKAETAQGNFDQARSLVSYAMENPIAGRNLGGKAQAALAESMKNIDDAEKEYNDKVIARQDRDDTHATVAVSREILGIIQNKAAEAEKSGSRYVTMSFKDRQELVSGIRSKFPNISDETWTRLSPDFVGRIAGMEQAISEAGKEDRDQSQSVMALRLEREAYTAGDLNDLEKNVLNALESGQINEPQARRALDSISRVKSMGASAREAIKESVQRQLGGYNWSGISSRSIDPTYEAELERIGDSASTEIFNQVSTFASSPEFRQKYGNDATAATQAIQSYTQDLIDKKRTLLVSQNQDKLKNANRLTSDAETTDGLRPDAARAVAVVLAGLGINEDTFNPGELGRVTLRAQKMIMDRLKEETSKATGTAAARRDAALGKLPDIVDDVISKLPESLPPSAKNAVRAAKQGDISAPPKTAPTGIVTTPGAVGGSEVGSRYRPLFAISREGLAFTGREASVGQSMNEIVKANRALAENQTPESIQQFESSKRTLQSNTDEALREYSQLTTREYVAGFATGTGFNTFSSNVGPLLAQLGKSEKSSQPAFEFRPEGVYAPDMNSQNIDAPKQIDSKMTARYWVYRSLTGYRPEEISAMKTKEGLDIKSPYLDPSTFMFFRSREEFEKADREYKSSNGSKGYIAETLLPKLGEAGYNTTYEDLIGAQAALIRIRLPLQ